MEKTEHTPWRERPALTLQLAAQIVGLSTASLYLAEARGDLAFLRLGGRTLVQTASLIKYVDGAEAYKPHPTRGAAGRAKRAANIRSNEPGERT